LSAKRKPIEKNMVDISQGFGENYSRDELIEEQWNDSALDVYRKRASETVYPKMEVATYHLIKVCCTGITNQTQIQRW
jgi:hypothetical protein